MTGPRPRFSVVIPVFNRPAMVATAVRSVLAQEEPPLETLVVDDGSTDGTADALREFGDRIRVIRQENRGAGAARNRGAHEATGEYLAFLDSDDVWYPWTLVVYGRVLEGRTRHSILVGRLHPIGGDPPVPPRSGEDPVAMDFPDYLASTDQWRWRGASSFVLRRDAFLRAGGFREDGFNAEDADLMLRLGTSPGFVQVTEPATFGYRVHAGSLYGDSAKNAGGIRRLVREELSGGYPGGRARRRERRRAIGSQVRPASIDLLRRGLRKDAWCLYRGTLAWSLAEGRFRYLLGFPLVAAGCLFRKEGSR